jgi:uncharacterized Zn finger protein (UPF0148 family)
MFCEQCGEQLSDSALFCQHCGTKTNSIENAAQEKSLPGQDISSKPTFNKAQSKNDDISRLKEALEYFEEKSGEYSDLKRFSDERAALNKSASSGCGLFVSAIIIVIVAIIIAVIVGIFMDTIDAGMDGVLGFTIAILFILERVHTNYGIDNHCKIYESAKYNVQFIVACEDFSKSLQTQKIAFDLIPLFI